MHIDRADDISMSRETAFPTVPLSALGLMSMPTFRTLATCSSFRASEAHDVGLLAFVSEIVDITPVLPQGHALVVVPATIPGTDTMRITNEEGANFLLNTEINHVSCGFVSHITDTSLYPATRLVL